MTMSLQKISKKFPDSALEIAAKKELLVFAVPFWSNNSRRFKYRAAVLSAAILTFLSALFQENTGLPVFSEYLAFLLTR